MGGRRDLMSVSRSESGLVEIITLAPQQIHRIRFRVDRKGQPGFAVGVLPFTMKGTLNSGQPGSQVDTWGCTSYDGKCSGSGPKGGNWCSFIGAWESDGVVMELVVDLETPNGRISLHNVSDGQGPETWCAWET